MCPPEALSDVFWGVPIATTQWDHPIGSLLAGRCAHHAYQRNEQREAKKSEVLHLQLFTFDQAVATG
jgi:hypothetical protein